MGYMTELNTLLKVPKNFDIASLEIGKKYTILKEKERSFPLHIAMLLVGDDWTFYGYAVAHEAVVKDHKTQLTFEVLSLFTSEEQSIYTKRFLEAAHMTGEV
jgi:hypothetical protein